MSGSVSPQSIISCVVAGVNFNSCHLFLHSPFHFNVLSLHLCPPLSDLDYFNKSSAVKGTETSLNRLNLCFP